MIIATRWRRATTLLTLLTLLAGAGVVAAVGPARAAVPGEAPQTWSVQQLPAISSADGWLSTVSCTSATFCMAAGKTAVRWNGSTWRQVPMAPAGFASYGISCTSSTFCAAVGSLKGVTGVSFWNGTSWRFGHAWKFRDVLTAVSCPADDACLAVGSNEIGRRHIPHPIAQWWDGAGWKLAPIPGRGSLEGGQLTAVSCSAPAACTAVGSYQPAGSFQDNPLVERWDGTSLTQQQTAAPSENVSYAALPSVSCPAADGCISIGEGSGAADVQIWNGTQWTAMNTSALPGTLTSLSCTAITSCLAVGFWSTPSRRIAGTSARLAGSTWSVQRTGPVVGLDTLLSSVSCATASDCAAAGTYESRSKVILSLAELWNGSRWAVRHPPDNPAPAKQAKLIGISCPAPTTCTAVGNFTSAEGTLAPLSGHWDGTQWTLNDSPRDLGIYTRPTSVSCPTASRCLAVGTYTLLRTRPWAAVWNGKRWHTEKPPAPPGRAGGWLGSVSCASATSCVAVGNNTRQLSYAWNGTRWTRLPVPASLADVYLQGVSCVSAASCVAVGNEGPQWIAEAWNGQTWTGLPTSGDTDIRAVSCTSATACTAVGSTIGGYTQPVIEHWNGTAWAAQTPAQLPSGVQSGALSSVSCASATACTAVGEGTDSSQGEVPIIQAWNGTTWVAQQAADTSGTELSAVSCPAPAVCTAVGAQYVKHLPAPMAESSTAP